jgi:exopolysaccharide biosynthesis polyprenyl glycosylphosphotransferase
VIHHHPGSANRREPLAINSPSIVALTPPPDSSSVGRLPADASTPEPAPSEPDPLPPGRASRLAAGFSARINLVFDVVVLFVSLQWSTTSGRGILDAKDPHLLPWFAVAAFVVWLVGTSASHHYATISFQRRWSHDAAIASLLVLAEVSLLATMKVVHDTGTLPSDVRFVALFLPLVLGARLFVFRAVSAREAPCDDVLVVGCGPLGRATGRELVKSGRRRLVGYVGYPDEVQSLVLRNPMVGTVLDLENILRTLPIGEVYVTGDGLRDAANMQRAVSICESLGVPFALPVYSLRLERAVPRELHGAADGYLHYRLAPDGHQLGLKRLFDILVSAGALFALAPLFPFVAIAIKLTSRGPVFFKQVRCGLHGREFKMLKFRTMVVEAEARKAELAACNEQTGPVFKIRKDPRITAVGRTLRRYSIDELPQLLNVLRGDMSLVGPRPPVPAEVRKYDSWQRRRLSVRPGLTCIWQVSGRSEISFEQWMYMDMEYIDNWSLRRDVNLLLRTLPAVISGRGAS